MTGRVALALVHYPCVDRHGEIYATSLTNLDVHDIARSSRTYDVAAFYIVHSIAAQQDLARAIAGFWDERPLKNPDRKEALSRVKVVASVEEAVAAEAALVGRAPFVISTSAKAEGAELLPWEAASARMKGEASSLLLFGTGHGLAKSVLDLADARLPPIQGGSDYNHLSVRSAVAICLDRLLRLD